MPLTSLLQANYDDEALEFEELVRSRVHAVVPEGFPQGTEI